MRVTLAAPFEGHATDETVDLPKKTARRLLGDGKARLPAPEPEPAPVPDREVLTAWGGHVVIPTDPVSEPADVPRHDSGTGRTEES